MIEETLFAQQKESDRKDTASKNSAKPQPATNQHIFDQKNYELLAAHLN